MKYFAYGSNMSSQRLKERVPSARALGKAKLPGHSLAWHKIGKDGSGKCDIVEASDDCYVWGVLYCIDPAERYLLDRAEDLGQGYEEKAVDVIGDDGNQPIRAYTYCALKIDPILQPLSWYKAHVLTGAREHELPIEYVAMIASVKAIGES